MNDHLTLRARSPLALMLALAIGLLFARIVVAQQPAPASLEQCPGEYLIGPEDVLDIAVWNSTELSRAVPVRPDGKISLPLVNDMQAAGFTPMQLRDALIKSLATYIGTPNVSVIVREVHSFKVTVLGEVKTPGRYELKSRSTVLDLLAMAGGPTDYASHDRMTVVRTLGASTEHLPFSLDKATAKRGAVGASSGDKAATNFCLMPGDILLVP